MVMKRLLAEHDARPTRAQEVVMGYYAEGALQDGFLPYRDYLAPHANRPTPRRPHFGRGSSRLDFAGSQIGSRLFKGHRP